MTLINGEAAAGREEDSEQDWGGNATCKIEIQSTVFDVFQMIFI